MSGQHPLDPTSDGPRVPATVLEQLPKWREQWDEIWYVQIHNKHYVYRSPTRREAIEHDMNVMSVPELGMDSFVSKCILYPEDLPEDMTLADLQGLYESIWRASGFKDTEAFELRVAEFDNALRSPDQENILMMMKAFPGLLPDTINSWQPEKIIYHVALARIMLGMEPLKLPSQPKQGP